MAKNISKLTLGIDIGGSKVRAVFFKNGRRTKTLEWKLPTNKAAFIRILKNIEDTAAASGKFKVGIGCAGMIQGTKVHHARNIPYFRNFDFRQAFPKATALRVDNDARAFLRGEYHALNKKPRRVFGLILGTGIGRAFISQGKIRPLKRFEHAEIWEGTYQKLGRNGNTQQSIKLIAGHVAHWAKELSPDLFIVGGGAFENPQLFKKLMAAVQKQKIKTPVKKTRLKQNAVATGAALLFGKI